MKRFFLCFSLLLLLSCAKTFEAKTEPEGLSGTYVYSINAESAGYTPDDSSKAQSEAVVRVKWEQGDKVSVLNLSTGTYMGDLEAQSGGYTVTFSGTITGTIQSGNKVAYIYPAFENTTSKAEGGFSSYSVDLSSQSYDASNGTSVALCAYCQEVYEGSSHEVSKTLSFTLATSYAKLNMAGLKESTASDPYNITKVLVTDISSGFSWKIGSNNDLIIEKSASSRIAIACSNVKTSSKGNAIVNFAVPESDATTSRNVVVNNRYETSFPSSARVKSKFYNVLVSSFSLVGFTASSEGQKVCFSKGNLQAQVDASGSVIDWKFADNQYDCIGDAAANTSIGSTAGYVDLFGWSTDGAGATTGWKEWGVNKSTTSSDYKGSFKDWASSELLKSSLGIGWFTPSQSQLNYILNTRNGVTIGSNNNVRFAEVKVNDVKGILIFPDYFDWTGDMGDAPTIINNKSQYWNSKNYTVAQFTKLEEAGCVFLPATGYRDGSSVDYSSQGHYWTSSFESETQAGALFFSNISVRMDSSSDRQYGRSVRLVKYQ